jgi:hypothetical protein
LISHGKNILQRALSTIGIGSKSAGTFEASLEFSEDSLATNENAVLERIILGQLDVLTNTLVGSPQVLSSLLTRGKVAFLPDFSHIGVEPDFLLKGEKAAVKSVISKSSLEAMTFNTDADSFAVVSAPSTWRIALFESLTVEKISVWPIISATSKRNILRSENPFPENKIVTWSEGVI